MAEHFHQLDLCPHCDGLRVLSATRLDGVSIDLDAGPFSFRGKATVWLTPLSDDCPNTGAEVTRG
ncbi:MULTISPECIES: hypothetical protein [Streptomyces]|uniref:Uncharacterized protein n=1 Tax=Streptomyces canarius TaxID=285453 RepID=A0ABQ3CG56_9ACTN|nr:hypothetical protein [Streptomyces canarius]GHA09035.1 hypothetical protein GCM10010345_11820 [Streptomyces canarius]